MNSTIVSNNTIETYKNNVGLLKSLSIKLKSGSFNRYDVDLYNKLVRATEKEPTLVLTSAMKVNR